MSMRETMAIDDALIEEALKLTDLNAKQEAVDLALKTLIALRRQEKI